MSVVVTLSDLAADYLKRWRDELETELVAARCRVERAEQRATHIQAQLDAVDDELWDRENEQ